MMRSLVRNEKTAAVALAGPRPPSRFWGALAIAVTLAGGLALSGRAQSPAHQLAAYDGASGIGWTNTWSAALWAPDGYDPASDPLGSVNYAAPAPGRPGIAVEITLGEPPERPWAFTPVSSGGMGFYLNQVKTVEFDVYFEPDCTDAEAVWFILNDVGQANQQPLLVDLIPGWATMTTAQRLGPWHHITVDLAAIGAHGPEVSRLVLYHLGSGLAHLAVTDITLGWDDDHTPPSVTSMTHSFNATNDQLSVTFTTDEMTIYRVEYGVGDFTNHVQGDYHDWGLSHTVGLVGLTPGVTNQYRILLLDHQLDPTADSNLGAATNLVYIPANAPTPTPLPPLAVPQYYLSIYDSTNGGVWTNGWVPGFWAPNDYNYTKDPLGSANFSATAPGFAGTAMELTLGEPPDRPWALTPVGTSNSGYFLNELRTLEFDVYFPEGCSDPETLWIFLNDAGLSDQPLLTDLIPGWFTLSHSQRFNHWFHVAVDLASLHPVEFSISRLVFYHLGTTPVHLYLANLRFGVVDRLTPPAITLTTTNLSYDYRQLTLGFTTDEATLYRVEYGISDYSQVVQGAAGAWDISHTATLTGLAPGTTCQYRIVAWDHRMDPNATPNQTVLAGVFQVPPAPTNPPVIFGLAATNIAGSHANLSWSDDRPCVAAITYHKAAGSSSTRSLNTFSLTGSCLLDLLEPATVYTATLTVTDAFSLSTTQTVTFATSAAGAPSITITVNPSGAHPISPWIYGINFYQQIPGAPPNLTLNRMGGNRWTAYNWENNASNAGSDWLYESDDYLSSSSVPAEAIRGFIAGDRARGNASLMTVPLLGYVAADENGPVDLTDPNHIANRFKPIVYQKGAPFTSSPDPNDASVYIDESAWAVRGKFPGDIFSDPVMPTFISLDNEPDIWSGTHKEILPAAMPPALFIQKTISLSTSLKSLDPAVKLFGPVNYGLYGMTTWQGAPGYNPNNWFVDDYLRQMRAASEVAGRRLLDVYDFHWYSSVNVGNDNVIALTGTNLTADQIQGIVQSPRSLWDTNYSENSWIVGYLGGPIAILPRMQSRIDALWPGTGLAITEYANGGDNHISGAIAQADNLGIFGSQGLFAASFWPMSSHYPFILGAFRMFRDYDGANGAFGDISLPASSSATTNVVAYVSQDSTHPGRYVIVALNRSFTAQDVGFSGLAAAGTAKVYRMEGTNSVPVFVGQVPAQLASWVITLPALSVSTLEITVTPSLAVSLNVTYGPVVRQGQFIVRFAGIPGLTYTIESTDTLSPPNWQKTANATAPTTPGSFGVGVFQFTESAGSSPSRFYRTVYPAY